MRGGGFFGPEYQYASNHADTYIGPNPYTEWIEVAIEEPVYIVSLIIGAPRGPGTIVGIRALGPDGEWVQLYQAPPLLDTYKKYKKANEYFSWAPPICRADTKASI